MGKMMKYLKQYQILCGFFLTICLLRLWGESLLPAGLEVEKEKAVSSFVEAGQEEMAVEAEVMERSGRKNRKDTKRPSAEDSIDL